MGLLPRSAVGLPLAGRVMSVARRSHGGGTGRNEGGVCLMGWVRPPSPTCLCPDREVVGTRHSCPHDRCTGCKNRQREVI